MIDPEELLSAAKADHIPEGWAGLWFITKGCIPKDLIVDDGILPAGIYTHLFRMTDSTMHLNPPGAVVMEDTPFELKKHLNFMLKARGRVLVTGLGLGCVVRGLLANPAVEHVTCIEKSPDVLKLVGPYMPKDRLTIIQADALEWVKFNEDHFDYAWHDLWTDRDKGEPFLDLWHTRLMFDLVDRVEYQGAWNYNRISKKFLKRTKIKLVA